MRTAHLLAWTVVLSLLVVTNGASLFIGEAGASSSRSPTLIFALAGNSPPTGAAGENGRLAFAVPIPQAPLSARAAGPPSAPCGTPAGFNGTAKGGQPPYSWGWNFGDGATATVENPLHAYSAGGAYPVSLQVHDSLGQVAGASLTITIGAGSGCVPPLSIRATAAESSGTAPLSVSFLSFPSGGVPLDLFAWTFGDGGQRATTQNATHTYTTVGSYTARVWVNDSNGNSANATVLVSVQNAPPLSVHASMRVLNVSCSCDTCKGHAGMNVSLSAQVSGGAPPFTFDWSFGDGTPNGTGENITHAYVGQDPWNATVLVTDAQGGRAASNVTVTEQGLVFNCPMVPAPAPVLPTFVLLAVLGGATLALAVSTSVLLSRRRRVRPPGSEEASPSPSTTGAGNGGLSSEDGAQVDPDGKP